VIRGTPMMVQLVLIYFVVFSSVSISKFVVAFIAFGFNSGAYISEIFRAGIESIDKGQAEAGRSLGLSKNKTMAFIIIPQAVKNILPTLANEFIALVKETAIVGVIALDDLTRASDIVISITYSGFAPRIIIAVMYYIVIKLLTLGLGWFEKKLKKSDH
ncbi:MAG: amino acid ABC transporter permease, partial [Clostridia bacterium]